VLESTYVRPPLLPISDDERRRLAAVLAEVGLLGQTPVGGPAR
jgi:dihydrodipicolinate synthase/N-acetylneuraminate lyase